ncbi:hypothetical protein QTP70_034564, partial [Hemibagrus guttatus]
NTSPTMSPADLQAALLCQDAIIHTYQDQIEALQAKNLQLQQQSQTSTPPLPHLRESQKMALLEKFDGSTDCCQGFEHQCNIIFAHQPKLYVADTTSTRITLPREYDNLREVFCKERTSRLPPHCPWDCAIELLPSAMPPKSRVYPLSISLLHRGSTRCFFFVEKKDGGLHPCIDYRGLDAFTVRYPYPLPLVPATLKQLQGAAFSPNWT